MSIWLFSCASIIRFMLRTREQYLGGAYGLSVQPSSYAYVGAFRQQRSGEADTYTLQRSGGARVYQVEHITCK